MSIATFVCSYFIEDKVLPDFEVKKDDDDHDRVENGSAESQ